MLELATNRLSKLTSVANLFEALHENAMMYCALKGNDKHLRISMAGESDIDILFDESQREKLELLLVKLGFKKFDAIKPKQYPNIVDFLTLDVESGKIIHLHTHYRLSIGKPYLKGYQLHIEHHILSTRTFNQDFGTYCISHQVELMLLYLTESLKLRHRDFIPIYLKGKINVSQKATYEYNWLRKRITDDEITSSLRQIFNGDANVTDLFRGEFNRKRLHRLAPIVKRQLGKNRLYSSLEALALRWYREIIISVLRKLSRIISWPILSMRINPRGGVMVALTGDRRADPIVIGRMLKDTFGKKMDVYIVDLEWPADFSPHAGPSTLTGHLKPILNSKSLRTGPGPVKFLRCFKVLTCAMKNFGKMVCADAARKKGALVICSHRTDEGVIGVSDQSFLHDLLLSKNPFFKMLGAIGNSVGVKARRYTPDLLFHLIPATEETGVNGADKAMSEGSNSVAPVAGPNGFSNVRLKVMAIDAGKPLKSVLDRMKSEIWNLL